MPTKIFDDLPIEKQQLIKTSFLSLLEKKSIDKITFNNLAHEAGFARASLYVYFKDKKDLCNYVFSGFSNSITEKLKRIHEESNDLFFNAKSCLKAFQETIIEFDYCKIIGNVADGLKISPVEGYQFFEGAIDYIYKNFQTYDRNIVEIVLILLKHSTGHLFSDFNNNESCISKFEMQLELVSKIH